MIHDTPQGEHMAIFSNDPNQGIRDAGLERFIPTPVSSMTFKGNAGMNAKRRADRGDEVDNFKSSKRFGGVSNPGTMTPEQKASWMAKHGDSTRPGAPAKYPSSGRKNPPADQWNPASIPGRQDMKINPYTGLLITADQYNELKAQYDKDNPSGSGAVDAKGNPIKSPFANATPPTIAVPSTTLASRPAPVQVAQNSGPGTVSLAYQMDGIKPSPAAPAAAPAVAPSTLAGKSVPGASAILGAAVASPRQESPSAGYALPDGYVEKDPEIAARYAREDREAEARNASLREKYGPDWDMTPEQMREKEKKQRESEAPRIAELEEKARVAATRLANLRNRNAQEKADRYNPNNEPSMDPLNPQVYARLGDALAGAPGTFANYIARKTALAAGKVLPFAGGPLIPGRPY
jgi:hypothetical protein